MKFRLLSFLLIFTTLFIGIQCKAPRNNPLDPLNPDYDFGTIEGVVQSIGIPSVGISNVRVLWQNANLITETDITGRFRLSTIPVKDGNIIFSKDGYKSDTLTVVWRGSKRFFTQVFFNRIPTLDSVSIYTIVINQTQQPTISNLYVKAWVTDLDDDLETVYVVNESLTLKKPLTELTYETTVTETEMGGIDIEETIGLDFSIVAEDKFENEFIIGSDRITRVIREEVTGLFPSGDITINDTSQPVLLSWDEFESRYDFTYMIEVYSRDLLNSQLIYSVSGIQSNTTSYTLPVTLPNNRDYYWTIWTIDKFQNRCRSKPVLFKISAPPP